MGAGGAGRIYAPVSRQSHLGHVRDAKAGGMRWVLGAASQTPFLIVAYALGDKAEAWTDRDHLGFWKPMLEHVPYLRYTSVPIGPWSEVSPFGREAASPRTSYGDGQSCVNRDIATLGQAQEFGCVHM